MEFTFYQENISHGLKLSQIHFNRNSFMLVDSDDYWDDDSEWEEYYIIEEDDYSKIIENVKKQFSPYSFTLFDEDIKNIYDSIENNNLKSIFLYLISIKNQFEEQIRGGKMIKILCGENIKYERKIYSKGP